MKRHAQPNHAARFVNRTQQGRSWPNVVVHVAVLLVLLQFGQRIHGEEEKPFGLDHRIPWTTSRVIGSPDPPLPYTVEPILTKIDWQAPIYAKAEPGTDRLFVVQQGGEKDKPSRVFRVPDDPLADHAETVLELRGRLIYGVTFHPDYHDNGWLFVFSNGPTGQPERKNRISRFTVDRNPPRRCDPNSEQVIIQWRSMGHDGGDLVFGHDRMLYISSGDGTSDSDAWVTGQDVSDLLGGVLRIDVDRPRSQQPYSIPPDNPFVSDEGARDELWAFGLRNPWRLCVDRKTGQIWVGNNGQDLWETVHLVRRGENYGWSVYEGNHPFYLHRQRGPTPFVPPTIEHHHTESRSLTGGVVYYGEPLAELNGTYVYGDYSTGKIWGVRHDGTDVTWQRELADTTLQIAGFAVTNRGDLCIVDHGGGLYRLIKAPARTENHDFPKRLSETGLFVSVKDHHVQPGVIPYSVNTPGWTDGAHVDRFLALPGELEINYTPSRGWNFPDRTVLMQTLWFEDAASPDELRRIETRLLTRQEGEWVGYSYRWNDRQDDATLVTSGGLEIELELHGPHPSGQAATQQWRFPSRAECMSCHSRAVNFVLGLTELQMNRVHDYGGVRDNQLRTFEHIGMFSGKLPKPITDMQRLVEPYDTSHSLEARARSYLQANCSVCHVEAGGGNARLILEFNTARDAMNVFSARPQHDTFGIHNAMLIAPGDPDRSVLYQRVSRRGQGQMPPLVSNVVDRRAARLIHDWIKEMKPERKFVRDWKMDDLLPNLDDVKANRSFKVGETAFRDLGCIQCHRFHGNGGGAGPDLSGVCNRVPPSELLEAILVPSRKVAADYATTVILTTAGNTVQGRIERETDAFVVVRPSTSFAEPMRILKEDIEQRFVSQSSIMPSGMLNSLAKTEVLDLLAYLIADGQRLHASFRKETDEAAAQE